LKRILIFGNSGSGKSTLAKQLCRSENLAHPGLAHLDLDTLAWLATSPPKRKPLDESQREINEFINTHNNWVIEGCYSDLLEMAITSANEIIYMNLPVDACIANAKNRPWEPHKYESKQAQDNNLDMLIDWIRQYSKRQDTFSEYAHKKLYESFSGKKSIFTSNTENT